MSRSQPKQRPLSPAARDLLSLLRDHEIPATKCDLRPKNELLRAGLVEYKNMLTNSRRALGGDSYTIRCLFITEKGRKIDATTF